MSQELINNLRRTKLDAIVGHYSGGNDEGGIEGVEMDLWTLISPFEQAIHGKYGSFAGDYYVSGEFYATRDGRFHVAGIESVPREEDVCLVDEKW